MTQTYITHKYIMQQILDAAQSITYDNLDDAKESLIEAIEAIDDISGA